MAGGLVDSIHPLVQNIILLNPVYLLPIRLWGPMVLFRPSDVLDGHVSCCTPCSLQS